MLLSGTVKGRRNGVGVVVTVGIDEEGELRFELPGGQAGGRARIASAEFELDREEFDQVVSSLDAAHAAMQAAKNPAPATRKASANGGQRSRAKPPAEPVATPDDPA
jgi:hypothetical protein